VLMFATSDIALLARAAPLRHVGSPFLPANLSPALLEFELDSSIPVSIAGAYAR
jgi:hypothetical protein